MTVRYRLPYDGLSYTNRYRHRVSVFVNLNGASTVRGGGGGADFRCFLTAVSFVIMTVTVVVGEKTYEKLMQRLKNFKVSKKVDPGLSPHTATDGWACSSFSSSTRNNLVFPGQTLPTTLGAATMQGWHPFFASSHCKIGSKSKHAVAVRNKTVPFFTYLVMQFFFYLTASDELHCL